MTRRTGQQNIDPENERENEDLSTVEEFQDGDLNFEPSFTQKITEFLQKAALDVQPVFYLYKYENYMNGEAKALIQKYKDCDPPDEDDIGRAFGSGRYLLCMAVPPSGNSKKGAMRAYRFRVHPHYDTIRNANSFVAPYPIDHRPAAVQTTGSSSLIEAVTILERLMLAMAPMMNREQNPDMQAMLLQNFNTTNSILKRQMLDNVDLLTDYQRKIADVQGENMGTATEELPGPSIVEQIAPLLNEWLPRLLGGGAQAKAVQQVVKMSPQFSQIIKDRGKFKQLVSYLDKTRGKEETEKVLLALKLKR